MSDWDAAGPDEPEEGIDAKKHAGMAMNAASHAVDSAQEARKHADAAKQHAAKLDGVEEALARAEHLSGQGAEIMQAVAQAIAHLADTLHSAHKESMERISNAIEAMGKPRRTVIDRDESGRAKGATSEVINGRR